MKTLSQAFDRFIGTLGRMICWLSLVMTLATFLIVILRYGFQISATPVRDAVIYCHAVLILLGISYTLLRDEHVRVDLIYSRMTPFKKEAVNLVGALVFLLPLCIVILIYTVPYAAASWRIFESSAEVDGLPGIFLLKTLLPVSAGLLLLQSLNEALKTLVKWSQRKRA